MLLSDKNIKRWFDNVGRGSVVTADVYLRRLGHFCDLNTTMPQALIQLKPDELGDLLLDNVTEFEREQFAGSYIQSTIKTVKSWLAFNNIRREKKIKIRNAEATPSLKDERVPTREELKKILFSGDKNARVAVALVRTLV